MNKKECVQKTLEYTGEDDTDLLSIVRHLHMPVSAARKLARDDSSGSADEDIRPFLDDWLSVKMQAVPDDDLLGVIRTGDTVRPLSRLVLKNRIVLGIDNEDKESVLRRLLEPLVEQDLLEDPDRFLERLVQRESLASTGIEPGLAIPHVSDPDSSGLKETCAVLGISKDGVEFGGVDGGRTFVFALLCARSMTEHLRLLAKMTLLFRVPDIVNQLRFSKDEEAVFQLLMRWDSALAMMF